MASEFLSNGSDALQILAQGRSRMVMTSGGIEPAPDSAGGTHSVFANVFVQLLRENDGPLLGGKLVPSGCQRREGFGPHVPEYSSMDPVRREGGEFVLPAPDVGDLRKARPNFAVIRVFYATDRQRGTFPSLIHFHPDPDGRLTLGTFDVSIPREHRLAGLHPRLQRQLRIDYAQTYARGDPNSAQINPPPPNRENKTSRQVRNLPRGLIRRPGL